MAGTFSLSEPTIDPPPPPVVHSIRIWVALQSSEAKQCTVSCGYDHVPVSRGYMRAQYPLLMAPGCANNALVKTARRVVAAAFGSVEFGGSMRTDSFSVIWGRGMVF